MEIHTGERKSLSNNFSYEINKFCCLFYSHFISFLFCSLLFFSVLFCNCFLFDHYVFLCYKSIGHKPISKYHLIEGKYIKKRKQKTKTKIPNNMQSKNEKKEEEIKTNKANLVNQTNKLNKPFKLIHTHTYIRIYPA